MRRLAPFAALPLAVLLSGCFQIFSTLTVRPDGSAVVVERVTAEGAMAMGLMAVGQAGGSNSFEARASSLGEGVTLASVEQTYAPGSVTYVVTYDVADVNQLAYDLSDAVSPDEMGESIMGGVLTGDDEETGAEWEEDWDDDEVVSDEIEVEGDEEGEGEIEAGDEASAPYRFAFEPASGAGPATLQITVPEGAAGPGDLDASQMGGGGDSEEDTFNRLLVLFGTMTMRFDVAVNGTLVEADRGWADGARVTLSDVQMAPLLEYARDEIADGDVQAFLDARTQSEDVDIPGLRAVAPGTVTVRFR